MKHCFLLIRRLARAYDTDCAPVRPIAALNRVVVHRNSPRVGPILVVRACLDRSNYVDLVIIVKHIHKVSQVNTIKCLLLTVGVYF